MVGAAREQPGLGGGAEVGSRLPQAPGPPAASATRRVVPRRRSRRPPAAGACPGRRGPPRRPDRRHQRRRVAPGPRGHPRRADGSRTSGSAAAMLGQTSSMCAPRMAGLAAPEVVGVVLHEGDTTGRGPRSWPSRCAPAARTSSHPRPRSRSRRPSGAGPRCRAAAWRPPRSSKVSTKAMAPWSARKARRPSSMRAASRSEPRRSPAGRSGGTTVVGVVVLGTEPLDLGIGDLRPRP